VGAAYYCLVVSWWRDERGETYLGFTIWHSLFTGTFGSLELWHSKIFLSCTDQLDLTQSSRKLTKSRRQGILGILVPLAVCLFASLSARFLGEVWVQDTH